MDSRQVQTEQFHDHVGARRAFDLNEQLRDSSEPLIGGGTDQDRDRRERIRVRAYELWEQEGRPDGREQLHWSQAEF